MDLKDLKPVAFLTLSLPFGRNFLVCLSGTVLPEWSHMRPTLSASRTGALSLTAFVPHLEPSLLLTLL
jgi:hypothetical protein